jgi:hypothetical protein
MNRHDRRAWASAATWDDLGQLVVAWLHGELEQTPGHLGPPCAETIPLIPALEAANRGGFVTDNSQQAAGCPGSGWEAWVEGFASDDTLARLRATVEGTRLTVAACRGSHHEGHPGLILRFCPWRDSVAFWSARCPALAGQLADAWYVTIADPEPARNDLLWPALAAFAATSPEVGCFR